MQRLRIAAVVLAAGESSRMGRPKPLLPLDGETFLGHLLAELRASQVQRIVVVLGFRPEVILEAMPEIEPIAVRNPSYTLGQLSSLHVGLDAVADEADAIVMCLADHPLISRVVVDAVIQAHESTGRPIVIPTHRGRRGHPTLFGRSLFRELREAPMDEGARIVVRAHADEVLEVETDEDGVLADIDTPQQYEEWRRIWLERQGRRPVP